MTCILESWPETKLSIIACHHVIETTVSLLVVYIEILCSSVVIPTQKCILSTYGIGSIASIYLEKLAVTTCCRCSP